MIHSGQQHAETQLLPRDATIKQIFLKSRLWTGLRAILLLQFLGSAGYWVIGKLHAHGALLPQLDSPWSMLDCHYMTVITISTIGYGETFPLPEGTTFHDFPIVRMYTILLITFAMIFVAYAVSSATAFLVRGDLQRLISRRQAMKDISQLSGHFIVCGHGTVGEVILQELLASGHTVVVIDDHPDKLTALEGRKGVIALGGDATEDGVLTDAGLARAGGLAAALPNDKDNLFLIVSVKQLRQDIRIVSRASDKAMCTKLQRAGADAVVSVSGIGGMRLASELIRPAVVGFLDLMLRQSDSPVRFAQVRVGSSWNGKTIGELDPPGKEGLPVLAIRKPGSNTFEFNPGDALVLATGMDIVTMGEATRVKELMARIGDTSAPTFAGDPNAE